MIYFQQHTVCTFAMKSAITCGNSVHTTCLAILAQYRTLDLCGPCDVGLDTTHIHMYEHGPYNKLGRCLIIPFTANKVEFSCDIFDRLTKRFQFYSIDLSPDCSIMLKLTVTIMTCWNWKLNIRTCSVNSVCPCLFLHACVCVCVCIRITHTCA